MKYVVIGAGPTGLSLAHALANNNYEVDVIERDIQLGGSWNAQWKDGKYFSENSPRVIGYNDTNLQNFFYDIGIRDEDLSNIYGNIFKTNKKVGDFLNNYFTAGDYMLFIWGVLNYKTFKTDISVQEWMDKNDFSEGAKKAIRILSILFCDVPENTHVNDLFGTMGLASLKQFNEPNKWHQLIEDKFSFMPHVNIYKGTEVINLSGTKDSVSGAVCKNLTNGKVKLIEGDRFILACQSSGIGNIIKNSNTWIKNNWISYDWMKEWSENTYYSDIGIQLHFREKINFPEQWCWTCKDDWTIIMLPVSDWLTEKSKEPLINTVWSACVVDMDTKSKHINKTANECSREEITEECVRQIRNADNTIPVPYKTTLSDGLIRLDNKWKSKNTGFTRKQLGHLQMQGNIPNLFALGCFTEGNVDGIAAIGPAINASVKFLETYERGMESFHNKYHKYRILIMIAVFLAYCKYLQLKRK
jgi:hypothetical protein